MPSTSRIKATINDAAANGLATNDAVKARGFSVSQPKRGERNKFYLEPEELSQLQAVDWLAMPKVGDVRPWRLQRVADVIVANCDTGTRHSDLAKLRRENRKQIGNLDAIEVVTEKTKSKVLIPIFGSLGEILEKYGYDIPTITKTELTMVGRIVLRLAGIDRQVAYRTTKGNKLQTEHRPMWQCFSPHVCRRTCAAARWHGRPTSTTPRSCHKSR